MPRKPKTFGFYTRVRSPNGYIGGANLLEMYLVVEYGTPPGVHHWPGASPKGSPLSYGYSNRLLHIGTAVRNHVDRWVPYTHFAPVDPLWVTRFMLGSNGLRDPRGIGQHMGKATDWSKLRDLERARRRLNKCVQVMGDLRDAHRTASHYNIKDDELQRRFWKIHAVAKRTSTYLDDWDPDILRGMKWEDEHLRTLR